MRNRHGSETRLEQWLDWVLWGLSDFVDDRVSNRIAHGVAIFLAGLISVHVFFPIWIPLALSLGIRDIFQVVRVKKKA